MSEVFGADSVENNQFGHVRLDEAPTVLGKRMPLHVVRDGYSEGIARTIAKLHAVIELLEEKVETPAGDSAARARRWITSPPPRQRLGPLLLVAGFQASISGRSWVSTEGMPARASKKKKRHFAEVALDAVAQATGQRERIISEEPPALPDTDAVRAAAAALSQCG